MYGEPWYFLCMICDQPHSEEQMQGRHIDRIWDKAAITAPDWAEADPDFPQRIGSYDIAGFPRRTR
jgi:hypothetical protein